jgi:hypothetical protein
MPFPVPIQHTIAAIYAAWVANAENWDSLGISVGDLGNECERSLYYSFRWATPLEIFTGKQLRLFETGNIEERRMIEDLERAGVEVFGEQDRIRLVAGHVRGKIDGRALNLPEAPKTEHLAEFKSSNDKNFKLLVKDGCAKAKPQHYVQCQIGMHAFGLTRALYLVVNKNDDQLYQERIEYDAAFCMQMLAKAERIVKATRPPAKISEKHDYYLCSFCNHQPVCHYDAFPRITCRSCIHSTPEMSGDAHWSCARWAKPLSFDEQKAACPTHLFDPDLVPGEQIDSDEGAETITYRMKNGSVWTDGTNERIAA